MKKTLILWVFLLYSVLNVSCIDNNDGAVTIVEEENGSSNGDGTGPVKVGIDHIGNSGSLDQNVEPFVATNEWQKVKKDQTIPKGLHVRMNIQTNEIEAKLLDEKDGKDEESAREERKRQMVDIQQSAADADFNRRQMRLSRSEIKEVLKNFKHDQDDGEDQSLREETAKKKLRSMDELKKEMKKIQLNLQTDSEIIDKLWERYTQSDVSADDKLYVLNELEYYLHQYDNAQNFAKMGGLGVLNNDLNSTSDEIRRQVALVIASAVQSNPAVQIKAIEVGLMHHLIRLIAVERNVNVKTPVLGATASMIRRFPFAQKKFVQLGGLDALSRLFGELGHEKLQLKAVTLLGDLLNELNESEHHPDPHIAQENLVEKLRQYRDVGLKEVLSDRKWCQHITSLLHLPEHDSREKVLATMTSVLPICRQHFLQQINFLQRLEKEYETLAGSEESDDDQYFDEMRVKIGSILLRVTKSGKDEL